MRGALRGFHVSKQLAKESSIETPSLGGSRIHSAVLTAGLNSLPEKCRNEEPPSLSGSRRSDLADFIAQPKLCSFKAAEFLGKLGSRAQNGARGVLSGESRAESCGRAGGAGASFLLWGEPGRRWVWGWSFPRAVELRPFAVWASRVRVEDIVCRYGEQVVFILPAVGTRFGDRESGDFASPSRSESRGIVESVHGNDSDPRWFGGPQSVIRCRATIPRITAEVVVASATTKTAN
jgi:hypothetical protein